MNTSFNPEKRQIQARPPRFLHDLDWGKNVAFFSVCLLVLFVSFYGGQAEYIQVTISHGSVYWPVHSLVK